MLYFPRGKATFSRRIYLDMTYPSMPDEKASVALCCTTAELLLHHCTVTLKHWPLPGRLLVICLSCARTIECKVEFLRLLAKTEK